MVELKVAVLTDSLQARAGIATGLVVAGDDQLAEHALMGETPLLAAHLLSLAAPGAVVVSGATRRIVGGLFECRSLGRGSKGTGKPVDACVVLQEGAIASRFEARRADASLPLLGRDEELELLLRRWQQAKAGHGRVVLLTGEAGIGKSRLARALQERLRREPHTPLTYHCSPYHQDSALYPVIGQLTRAAGIEREDKAEAKLAKLEALLAPTAGNLAEEMPLFAALLSIPGGERHPLPKVAPRRLKELTLRALTGQLVRLAERQPVLWVVEDLHWVDPTTLDLLSGTINEVESLSVLLIATARPEFTPPWPSHRHVTTMALTRLDRTEAEALVAGVARGKLLPAQVLEQIVERTDGVPLFIEELTKTVLEGGALRQADDRLELDGALPSTAIPSTLHASLLARLDRLSSVKDVAQTGAVIGREFSYALIAATTRLPEKELKAALVQLAASELVFQRGTPPDASYHFKHALVRDAAYASLVKARRRQLHGRIAEALETSFEFQDSVGSEVLAYHYAESGELDRAARHWLKAGLESAKRAANAEAVRLLDRALAVTGGAPESKEMRRLELDVCCALVPSLQPATGFSAPRVDEIAKRGILLCEEFGQIDRIAQLLFGRFTVKTASGDLSGALAMAESMLAVGKRRSHPLTIMMGHRAIGFCCAWTGDPARSARELERALELAPTVDFPDFTLTFDPVITGKIVLAIVKMQLGKTGEGERLAQAVLLDAETRNHPPTLAYVLYFRAAFEVCSGRPLVVKDLALRLQALCMKREHEMPEFRDAGELFELWAVSQTLQPVTVPRLLDVLAAYRSGSFHLHLPFFLMLVADACLTAGAKDTGIAFLDEAENVVNATGQVWVKPYLAKRRASMLQDFVPPSLSSPRRRLRAPRGSSRTGRPRRGPG